MNHVNLSAYVCGPRVRQAFPCAISLLITESFYRFHSFTLECLAFLATWYALDVASHAFGTRLTRDEKSGHGEDCEEYRQTDEGEENEEDNEGAFAVQVGARAQGRILGTNRQDAARANGRTVCAPRGVHAGAACEAGAPGTKQDTGGPRRGPCGIATKAGARVPQGAHRRVP